MLRGSIGALALCVGLEGCVAGQRAKPVVIERDGVTSISTSAELQTAYVKNRMHSERFCAGPGTDAVSTAVSGLSLGVTGAGTGEEVGESSKRGAMALGGRNPEVLLARELLYRACELSMNLNADQALTMQIYERFLQAITTMASSQTGMGTTSLSVDPSSPLLQNGARSDNSDRGDDDDADDF